MNQQQEEMIMKTDIRELKLLDGSTIIAEVMDDNPETMLLFDPLQVVVGSNSAAFIPWFLTGDTRYYELYKEKTVAFVPCSFDYKIKYLQAAAKKQQMTLDLIDEEPYDDELEEEFTTVAGNDTKH